MTGPTRRSGVRLPGTHQRGFRRRQRPMSPHCCRPAPMSSQTPSLFATAKPIPPRPTTTTTRPSPLMRDSPHLETAYFLRKLAKRSLRGEALLGRCGCHRPRPSTATHRGEFCLKAEGLAHRSDDASRADHCFRYVSLCIHVAVGMSPLARTSQVPSDLRAPLTLNSNMTTVRNSNTTTAAESLDGGGQWRAR